MYIMNNNNLLNEHKYLIYEISDEYGIELGLLNEFLEQSYHLWLYLGTHVEFEDFLRTLIRIIACIFDLNFH